MARRSSLSPFAAALLAAALLTPVPAMAEGAIAASITKNFGEDGWSVAYSTNWASAAIAHRDAIRRCREGSPEAIARRCAIVSNVRRECMATAGVDPGPGFGWGIDRGLEAAQRQAMEMCRATAGPGRGDKCKLVDDTRANACDTRDSGR